MDRLGIGFWPDVFTAKDMVGYARKAEGKGYESVWIPEHYLFREAFSILGAIAIVTKRIKLATGVVNLYTRHPALIAMSIATLDELSSGRVMLGLGTGVSFWIEEQMGVKMEKPLSTMKEAVEIIRRLLRGEKVTYSGRIFMLKNMRFGSKPPQANVPIYMAAVKPKMLQLAGEIADGVVLTAGCSLGYMNTVIENIKIGAERAHRDPSQIELAALLICSVSEDSKAAKDATRKLVAFLMSRPGRAELMLEKEDLCEEELSLIKQHVLKGDLKGASAYVTEAMINSIAIAGTPQECREKIQAFRRAHVTLPIVVPTTPVETSVSAVLNLI